MLIIEILPRITSSKANIIKSTNGLYQVVIYSDVLVGDLIELGLCMDRYCQDLPFYDFGLLLEGIRSTHVYNKVSGEYRLNSFKIGIELCYRLGMEMRSEMFKETFIGKMGISYILT